MADFSFIPNYLQHYKTKDEAILGILESFVGVPNCADADGIIVFTLGNNLLKIKPGKKQTYEKDVPKS